ncbi:hypothetical protein [Singulisphaera sp. PoT]|uniref:hypothetical protein n=1 Tax=Singulisphaera sp. PoT TaxID=3411797 RepID=UPI003BF4A0F4
MPDYKATVIAAHSAARARWNPPVVGDTHEGHWAVYRSDEIGATQLGQGPSEAAAWADAASKLPGNGLS